MTFGASKAISSYAGGSFGAARRRRHRRKRSSKIIVKGRGRSPRNRRGGAFYDDFKKGYNMVWDDWVLPLSGVLGGKRKRIRRKGGMIVPQEALDYIDSVGKTLYDKYGIKRSRIRLYGDGRKRGARTGGSYRDAVNAYHEGLDFLSRPVRFAKDLMGVIPFLGGKRRGGNSARNLQVKGPGMLGRFMNFMKKRPITHAIYRRLPMKSRLTGLANRGYGRLRRPSRRVIRKRRGGNMFGIPDQDISWLGTLQAPQSMLNFRHKRQYPKRGGSFGAARLKSAPGYYLNMKNIPRKRPQALKEYGKRGDILNVMGHVRHRNNYLGMYKKLPVSRANPGPLGRLINATKRNHPILYKSAPGFIKKLAKTIGNMGYGKALSKIPIPMAASPVSRAKPGPLGRFVNSAKDNHYRLYKSMPQGVRRIARWLGNKGLGRSTRRKYKKKPTSKPLDLSKLSSHVFLAKRKQKTPKKIGGAKEWDSITGIKGITDQRLIPHTPPNVARTNYMPKVYQGPLGYQYPLGYAFNKMVNKKSKTSSKLKTAGKVIGVIASALPLIDAGARYIKPATRLSAKWGPKSQPSQWYNTPKVIKNFTEWLVKKGYGYRKPVYTSTKLKGGAKNSRYHGYDLSEVEDIGHDLLGTNRFSSLEARAEAIAKGKKAIDGLISRKYHLYNPDSAGYHETGEGRSRRRKPRTRNKVTRRRIGGKYNGIEDQDLENWGYYLIDSYSPNRKDEAISKAKKVADRIRNKGYYIVNPGAGRRGGDRADQLKDRNAIFDGQNERHRRDVERHRQKMNSQPKPPIRSIYGPKRSELEDFYKDNQSLKHTFIRPTNKPIGIRGFFSNIWRRIRGKGFPARNLRVTYTKRRRIPLIQGNSQSMAIVPRRR